MNNLISICKIRTEVNIENDYSSVVIIEYNNVEGDLVQNNSDKGFIIKKESTDRDFDDYITHITCLKHIVQIETNIPFCDFYCIDNFTIEYHHNENGIIDEWGNKLPEFGRTKLSCDNIVSQFIERIEMSNAFLFNRCDLSELEFSNEITYMQKYFTKCVCELPDDVVKDDKNNYLFFFRVKYKYTHNMQLYLRLRSGASMKIWENSELLTQELYKSKVYNKHILKYRLTPIDGVNEMVLAVETSYGRTKGFCMQMEIPHINSQYFFPEII